MSLLAPSFKNKKERKTLQLSINKYVSKVPRTRGKCMKVFTYTVADCEEVKQSPRGGDVDNEPLLIRHHDQGCLLCSDIVTS